MNRSDLDRVAYMAPEQVRQVMPERRERWTKVDIACAVFVFTAFPVIGLVIAMDWAVWLGGR